MLGKLKPSSSSEMLLSAIEAFRNKFLEASNRASLEQAASRQSAEETIRAARDFMEKSEIGFSACRVYDKTRAYGPWCTREDWPKLNFLDVTDVEPEAKTAKLPDMRAPRRVGFRLNGRKWAFEFTDNGRGMFDDDESYAKLVVFADDNLVMELSLARGDGEYEQWRPVDVRALTVGPWVADLVEADAKVQWEHERIMAEYRTEDVQEHAARIKL